MKNWILTIVLASAGAGAQDINLLQFDGLKSRASDTVEVNLSEPMLRMAMGFLSDSDAKQANVKRLIIGHFSARYKELAPLLDEARLVFPETALANEGASFELRED